MAATLRRLLQRSKSRGDEARQSGRMLALGLVGHAIRNTDPEIEVRPAPH